MASSDLQEKFKWKEEGDGVCVCVKERERETVLIGLLEQVTPCLCQKKNLKKLQTRIFKSKAYKLIDLLYTIEVHSLSSLLKKT